MVDTCSKHTSVAAEIVVIILAILCLIIAALIGYKSVRSLLKMEKLQSLIKYLFVIGLIASYIVLISHIMIMSSCSIHSISHISKSILITFYSILLLTILGTLLVRLDSSFNESVYALSRKNKYILIILYFLTISCVFGVIITSTINIQRYGSWVQHTDPAIKSFFFSAGIFSTITSIYAEMLFTKKIMKVIKLRATTMKNVMNENALKLNKKQSEMINQISRYISLLSIAIITSFICIVCIGFTLMWSEYRTIRITEIINSTLISIDSFLNVTLLYLQYPFATKYYDKYCQCLKAFWYCLIRANVEKSMSRKYRKSRQLKAIQLEAVKTISIDTIEQTQNDEMQTKAYGTSDFHE